MPVFNIDKVLEEADCRLILTMDCEGINFDKNLKNNILNLERLLKLAAEYNIYTILFITPYFADMLYRLKLTDRIKKDYRVIFGLHIHPDNLPEEIQKSCPFIRNDVDEIACYYLEDQKLIIKQSIEYLKERDVFPLQIFRGGYFSMDDNTAMALCQVSDIRWESHNIYRNQYKVSKPFIKSLPVYAFDKNEEFRLEYFSIEELLEMERKALDSNTRIVGITHSYLLDDNDMHYTRDCIEGSIYSRLGRILKEKSLYKYK